MTNEPTGKNGLQYMTSQHAAVPSKKLKFQKIPNKSLLANFDSASPETTVLLLLLHSPAPFEPNSSQPDKLRNSSLRRALWLCKFLSATREQQI